MTPVTEGPRLGVAERLVAAWMLWMNMRPRMALAGLAALAVLSVLAGVRFLGVDADSSRMLSPDLPAQTRAHAVNQAFPNLKSTIVVVVSADQADMADLAVAALIGELNAAPAIRRVFSPATDRYLAAHGFLFRDADEVADGFTRLTKSANLLARLRADRTLDGFLAALDEALILSERADLGPEALERLFAETAATVEAQNDGRPYVFAWSSVLDETRAGSTKRLISVLPDLDTTRLNPARPTLNSIAAAIAALPKDVAANVRIGVTGEPALRAEEMQSVVGTIGISLALSLLLVLVMLRLGLGSGLHAGLAFAALVLSLILTTGFAAVAVGTLNLVSVAFIVLMVGLGIDFAIHILAHIDEMHRHGTATRDAVHLTGQRTGLALALSALSTSAAFLAFTVTDFDGMAQLGLLGAAGVPIAFGVAATLIPAGLALFPGPRAARPVQLGLGQGPGLTAPVLILAAIALWPATQVRFDADPMALRDPDAPAVMAFRDLAEDPRTSPYRASVLVDSAAEADRIAALLEERPGVAGALNFGDLVPQDQDRKLDLLDLAAPSIEHAALGQPTALLADTNPPSDRISVLLQRLQARDDIMAQRLFRALQAFQQAQTVDTQAQLQTRLFTALPLMIDRIEAMLEADFVSRDTLPAPMRERFISSDGLYRVEILPEFDLSDPVAAQAFARTVTDAVPQAAGGPVQLAAAGQTVGRAMLIATLLAGLLTGLIAFAATRRLSDVAAILAPLVVAGVLTAAASTLLDVPFNYANVIVLPLMIGLGVDGGIHIAMRERRAPGAVFATSTPRAVILSAATTVAAFGTLALSDHRGTASMGILLAIAMLATVLSVLALTPRLIRWADRR